MRNGLYRLTRRMDAARRQRLWELMRQMTPHERDLLRRKANEMAAARPAGMEARP